MERVCYEVVGSLAVGLMSKIVLWNNRASMKGKYNQSQDKTVEKYIDQFPVPVNLASVTSSKNDKQVTNKVRRQMRACTQDGEGGIKMKLSVGGDGGKQ